LSQKEILALAISLEEEDERTYSDYGESLREFFPAPHRYLKKCARKKSEQKKRMPPLKLNPISDIVG
jgi:hypothetical protein